MFGFDYLGAVYFAGIPNPYIFHGTKKVLIDNVWVNCIVYILKNDEWTPTTVEVKIDDWLEVAAQ